MTQNDIIFLKEACGHKVNALIEEIVANANEVFAINQAKAQAKAAAEQAQQAKAEPKAKKSKKGE
jgi:hypothetical protein